MLTAGAGVVTSRGDVHYVVTEWGVADLYGKTMRERATALIHIAHPDFREELMAAARERRLVYADQIAVLGAGAPLLEEYESTLETRDGERLLVRPIRPTDEDMMRDMFYSFSEQTIYYRFFHDMKSMPHHALQQFVVVDYGAEMALVVVHRAGQAEEIVAVGRYAIRPQDDSAEVAFVVRDEWQRQGIGLHVMRQLVKIGREYGARKFVARVLAGNEGMIALFHRGALGPVESKIEAGEYELSFTVPAGGAAVSASEGGHGPGC